MVGMQYEDEGPGRRWGIPIRGKLGGDRERRERPSFGWEGRLAAPCAPQQRSTPLHPAAAHARAHGRGLWNLPHPPLAPHNPYLRPRRSTMRVPFSRILPPVGCGVCVCVCVLSGGGGVEWSGVEWSGMEWSGVEWSGCEGGGSKMGG